MTYDFKWIETLWFPYFTKKLVPGRLWIHHGITNDHLTYLNVTSMCCYGNHYFYKCKDKVSTIYPCFSNSLNGCYSFYRLDYPLYGRYYRLSEFCRSEFQEFWDLTPSKTDEIEHVIHVFLIKGCIKLSFRYLIYVQDT